MHLTDLSDDELVSRITAICLEGHRLTARLIQHLIEVEERRLDLKAACTSMFDFCVRKLGMSEGAAFRRINAARLVRRFPSLLAHIERGELHLSTLVLLRPHMTEANAGELVASVVGKTHREVEELLARRAPRPDVASAIVAAEPQVTLPVTAPAGPSSIPSARPAPSARIEPLSEARYKVHLTASTELRDKLERARDLMRHRNPSGDLAVVVERAMDLLLERLERESLGKAKRPAARAADERTTKPGTIPRAVRREVFSRDGEQCTFVDGQGNRCPSRGLLELDHVVPRALGGADEASNLRVRCRPHNRLHAEDVFGKEHVTREMDFRRRKSHRVMRHANDVSLEEASAPMTDIALRGLVNMGFARPDARRALDDVSRRHANDVTRAPVEQLLREAIAALT